MKNLLSALAVCAPLALIIGGAGACSAPSTTDQVANSNQAVVTNSNTAAQTTMTPPAASTPPSAVNTNSSNVNINTAAPTTTATTTAPTPAKEAAAAVDFTATRVQYAQNCAGCHGAGGEGMKMGTVNYPSLKTGSSAAHSDAQLNNYITNGHEGMPAFKGKLSAAQISTMVRYIRQELQGKK